jgi:hypothetical protein
MGHPLRRRIPSCLAAGLATAALACSRQVTPPAHAAPPDGGAPAAPSPPEQVPSGQPAAPEAQPAAPVRGGASSASATAPTSVPLPVTGAVAITGAEERPLALDAPTAIDPRSSFRLEVAAHLIDGRLSLLDEQGAMVASSGTVELGAASTRYQITPSEPLAPGATYVLCLDGVSSRDAHDPAGRAFTPVKLQILIAGDRPPPGPRKRRHSR